MTRVLAMVAIEQRHPVADVVRDEADDRALHAGEVTGAPSRALSTHATLRTP
jgi:hypothetical protein